MRPVLAITLIVSLFGGHASAQVRRKVPAKKPVISQEDLRAEVYVAAISGNIKALKKLVAGGAKVSNYKGLLGSVGGSPVQSLEIVKYLVSKGVDPNGVDEDSFGLSPVPSFMMRGEEYIESIRHLVENGARIKDRNKNGTSLLHLAVTLGEPKVVQYLIDKKLDVNDRCLYVDPFASQRNMPEALLNDLTREVEEVVSHMMEPGYRYSGLTPLHELRSHWNADVAKILIAGGANLKALDDNGWGVMHYAAVSQTTDMAKFFFGKGMSLEEPTKAGNRPLHLATHTMHGIASAEMVGFLVKSGADRAAKNNAGQTPIASLRESSDWLLRKELGSTDSPATKEDLKEILDSFNAAAKHLDPNVEPFPLPKLPSGENGTRYEPAMMMMLRAERWVRAEKDRVILTLRFSPLGENGLGIEFDSMELEGFDTKSKMPKLVELDAEDPTYVQFEFPAGATTGGRLNTHFRLVAGGMEDIRGEFQDVNSDRPVFVPAFEKKAKPVKIFPFYEGRTTEIRIEEVKVNGKVVPKAKGRKLIIEPGKFVFLPEAQTSLKQSCSVKFSYRYLPNQKWRSGVWSDEEDEE